MARGGRGASGQRAPRAAARAQGQRRGRSARWERLPRPCPRPAAPRASSHRSHRLQGRDRDGGQRHRGGPRRPRHAALAPSARPTRAPQTRKRRRTRAHLGRSRGAAGARGAAASPAAAAGRGVAGKAPFSGAARACSPPPSSAPGPRLRSSPRAAGRVQPGLPARAPAWRGPARPGLGLSLRRGRRTDTRSQEAGGPESPAWGRSEAAAGGRGRGVDSTAAAGPRTTFYIWPLVWAPRSRRGRRRETLGWRGGGGGGAVATGSRPGEGGGPRRTMHLGVKPRLRVSGPRPRPLRLAATVED